MEWRSGNNNNEINQWAGALKGVDVWLSISRLNVHSPRQVRGFLLPWIPRKDVRHQVGIDPADHV